MPLSVDDKGRRTSTGNPGGGASALWEALGGNDLVPTTPKPSTGASALRNDLEQAGAPSATSAGSHIDWSPTSGGGSTSSSYPVPSTIMEQEPTVPEYRPGFQTTTMPPVGTAASTGQPSTMASPTSEAARNFVTNTPELTPLYEALGIDVDHKSNAAQWEKDAAEREGRAIRGQNYWYEPYDTEGSEWGWFDNQLDNVGNTPANDKYVRWAISQGADPDVMYDIMHRRDKSYWDMLASKWDPTRGQYDYDVNKDSTGDITALDDGTFDYPHMTSDSMTGTQYQKYSAMGMGGLPVEQIDPSKEYSKRYEANEHGFIPFTPDETAYANMITKNVMRLPLEIGANMGRLREFLTPDYTVNYDEGGGRRSVSGRDFDKLSPAYMNNISRDEKFDPMKFITRQSNSNDSNTYVKEYTLPDTNGNLTYHYGSLREDEYGPVVLRNYDQETGEADGTYTIGFTDGSDAIVPQFFIDMITNDDGTIKLPNPRRVSVSDAKRALPGNLDVMNRDPQSLVAMAEEYGGSPLDYADVIYMPDMELSDGSRMSYNDVERLYYDQTDKNDAGNEDDDISYDFSYSQLPVLGELSSALSHVPLISALVPDNKPSRLSGHEMFGVGKDGGITIDPSDLGDNALDMTAGSLPISLDYFYFPKMYALSSMVDSLGGIDPSQYDPTTGSTRLLASHYDDEGNLKYGSSPDSDDDGLRYWNATINAATPYLEDFAGEGSGLVEKGLRAAGVPFVDLGSAPTIGQVLGNKGLQMFGEGLEELIGNVFDEYGQYGPEGAWANPILDERGNPMLDVSGHEMRDTDTSWYDRLKNFGEPTQWLNSFQGGATVEGYLDLLPFLKRLGSAANADNVRRRTGVSQYVDPDEEEKRKTVSSDYARGFSDDLGRSYA